MCTCVRFFCVRCCVALPIETTFSDPRNVEAGGHYKRNCTKFGGSYYYGSAYGWATLSKPPMLVCSVATTQLNCLRSCDRGARFGCLVEIRDGKLVDIFLFTVYREMCTIKKIKVVWRIGRFINKLAQGIQQLFVINW